MTCFHEVTFKMTEAIKIVYAARYHFASFCHISRINSLLTENPVRISISCRSVTLFYMGRGYFVFILSVSIVARTHHYSVNPRGEAVMLSYNCLISIHTLHSFTVFNTYLSKTPVHMTGLTLGH